MEKQELVSSMSLMVTSHDVFNVLSSLLREEAIDKNSSKF